MAEKIENKNSLTILTDCKLIINEFGNGFVNKDDKIIYIKKKDLNNAFHNEIVEIEYEYNEETESYSGKIINYSLDNKIMTGFVYNLYKNDAFILIPELKKGNLIMIPNKIKKEIQKNQKNIKNIKNKLDKNKLEKYNWCVIKILPNNNLNININNQNQLCGELIEVLPNNIDIIIEKKFNLSQILSNPNNENQPEQNSNTNSNINIKKIIHLDQRHLETFTVDPITCRDCDDAFSIELNKTDNKIHIYVHISDVAHYINPDNSIFEEVLNRGNTYYGKKKNWTMIPRNYADNICSILPDKDTYVITNEFIYEPLKGHLEYVGYFYSIIKSKNKYCYEYVDENPDDERFKIMYESSQIIKSQTKDFQINETTKSHEMVMYWMLKINQLMCFEVKKLYRCNLKPSINKFNLLNQYITNKYKHSPEKFNKFFNSNNSNNNSDNIKDENIKDENDKTTDENDEINSQLELHLERDEIVYLSRNDLKDDNTFKFIIKSLLTKAYYTEIDDFHYGLGVDYYTHWTSPIRRSADLLNHCYLKGYQIDFSKYIDNLNETELKQTAIENFIINYNNFQNIKINDVLDGVIINISQTGITVLVHQLEEKYSIHISKLSQNNSILTFDKVNKTLKNTISSYQMFDNIKVIVKKIEFDNIDLEILF